jgi:collagen type III alpha
MAMHIDKSQIKDFLQITTGSATLRRTPALQAGFKTYAAMAVGGAGGRNTQLAEIHRGAGGGGGGCVRVSGNIKDLPETIPMAVGAKGADASGSAATGGQSNFGTAIAYGGDGANAIVGAPDFPGQPEDNDAIASYGGEGGGNSFGVGAGGMGGIGRYVWNGTEHPRSLPTNGTYVDLGGGNGGGRGGGGGAGRSGRNSILSDPSGGSYGSVGGPQGAPGGVIDSHYGGFGGGADMSSIPGAAGHYGGGNGGSVAYKLT